MQEKLRRMREERADGDRGFTLIELLVVVVIIGVLIAIAIPLYLNYRKGAENKSAASDVRGAISAVEQFYSDNSNAYPATAAGTKGAPTTIGTTSQTQGKITVSSGNTIDYTLASGGLSYWVCGVNADGGTIYVYNSLTGGSVNKSTQTTLALCDTNGN